MLCGVLNCPGRVPRSPFADRSDERSVRIEFEQRVIAAVQQEDVALRVERHADGLRRPDIVRQLEEVFVEMKCELRRRPCSRGHHRSAAALP